MINAGRTLIARLMLSAVLAAGAQSALAETYEFNGVVTLCESTCDSFASLALGTTVTGTWDIETDPSGSWDATDISDFMAEVFNPGGPIVPWDGTNGTLANPLPLTPAIASIQPDGDGQPEVTGGTTNASNQLDSGTILHRFEVPPFSSNNAWVIFTINADGSALAKVCLFFTVTGCLPGATESVNIQGNFVLQVDPGDIRVDPVALDFGNVQINSVASNTVTVNNDGAGDLTITSIDDASLPAGITIDDTACLAGAIGPGGSCDVTVNVDTSAVGALSGTFTVNSDDPDTASVDVTVDANVVAGSISYSDNPLVFDLTDVGGMAQSTITVSNVGDGTLTIGAVAVADPLEAPFGITDACANQALAPAGTCDITVDFSPTAEGSFNDTFDVPSDDPDPDPARSTVTVSGDASATTEPRIAITPPGPVDLGDLLLGEMAMESLSVRNSGSALLTVNNITITGAACR
ncbi:MAG: choice-of-anchor D domain-containing protein, partial [Pseudomonadota bacterium]